MGTGEVLAELWGEIARIKLLVNKIERDLAEIRLMLQYLLVGTEVVIEGDN